MQVSGELKCLPAAVAALAKGIVPQIKGSKLRFLISGASGYIGAPLFSYFEAQGHEVISLSRTSRKNSIYWDPDHQLLPIQFLDGFDVVIHLAGDPLSFGRWSKKKKEKIYKSRIEGTAFLCKTLALLENPPKTFICASGIGFYGDRGDEILSEESSVGSGFLPSVCSSWERACECLKARGTRVINGRFGIVFGSGGVLKKIEPVYRMGLGAILGSGKQWISWIFLDDLIQAIERSLHSLIEGPVNFVAPNPIQQEVFSKALAKALHRPHFFRIPEKLLGFILGTMSREMLFASARVTPSKLNSQGFTFKYPKLEDVLQTLYLR